MDDDLPQDDPADRCPFLSRTGRSSQHSPGRRKAAAGCHCGRHSTCSMISARRSAIATSAVAPPAAAFIKLRGNVAPGQSIAAILRQMLLDLHPHVGERRETSSRQG